MCKKLKIFGPQGAEELASTGSSKPRHYSLGNEIIFEINPPVNRSELRSIKVTLSAKPLTTTSLCLSTKALFPNEDQ